MIFRFPTSFGEDANGSAYGQPSLEAAVRTALSYARDVDITEITITSLGTYVVLEGFVRSDEDMIHITAIAEEIAGKGAVHCRVMRKFPAS